MIQGRSIRKTCAGIVGAALLLFVFIGRAAEAPLIDIDRACISGQRMATLDMDGITDIFGRPDAVLPPSTTDEHGKKLIYAGRGLLLEFKRPEKDPQERLFLVRVFLTPQTFAGVPFNAFKGDVSRGISGQTKAKNVLQLYKDEAVDITLPDPFGNEASKPGGIVVFRKELGINVTFSYDKTTYFIDGFSVVVN